MQWPVFIVLMSSSIHCPIHVCAAGAPQNNDVTYCPANSTSCYFYKSTTSTNAAAATYCQSLGGYLVSWNSESEQLQVGSAGWTKRQVTSHEALAQAARRCCHRSRPIFEPLPAWPTTTLEWSSPAPFTTGVSCRRHC
jgi:hypothetical protein